MKRTTTLFKRVKKRWLSFQRDLKVFAHLFPWRVMMILLTGLFSTTHLFWLAHNYFEGERISWLKAMFAVINMTFLQLTFADMPASPWLDIFPIIIPLVGLPIFSIFGLRIIKIIRIFFRRGERGQEWQEAFVRSTANQHIIICGVGRVGYRVAKSLAFDYGQQIVGINDEDSGLVRELLARGVPIILGQTESEEMLYKAGIDRARVIVVCTNKDWANLGTAVLAHQLNPKVRIILRLFEDELMAQIKTRFHVETVISRSGAAAPTFAYGAIGGEIVETFKLAGRDYVLAQVPLGPTSPMLGRTIADLAETQDVTVVCHLRGQTLTVEPAPTTPLFCHDELFVFTTVKEMMELIDYGVDQNDQHRQKPVLVCGLGHTGYRVADKLLDLSCQVVGIDFKPTRLAPRLHERGMPLKFGDLRWDTILIEAGVKQATAVVACTEDDMTNLQIALRARSLNPMIRVVLRIFDDQLNEQLSQTLGANTLVYSTSALSAPVFVAAALGRANMRPVRVGGEVKAIVRLQVNSTDLQDVSLAKLHQEEDLTILLHARNGTVTIPPKLETRLLPGDEIVVMAGEKKLAALNRYNGG